MDKCNSCRHRISQLNVNYSICGNEHSSLFGTDVKNITSCNSYDEKVAQMQQEEVKSTTEILSESEYIDPVDDVMLAARVLKGYCKKHASCEDNCRFLKDDLCVLKVSIPCDWEI